MFIIVRLLQVLNQYRTIVTVTMTTGKFLSSILNKTRIYELVS